MNINSGNAPEAMPEGGVEPVVIDIRKLTTEQLAQLGMQQIAYVKPVEINGTTGFAIHAANGMPMGLAENRDVALAAIVQHEMTPVPVH